MSKNGILIVEFANKLQLRPIPMTTAATVAGHTPLILASDPGARNSIGIMLVSGMIIGTAFTLFVVPSIYLLAGGEDPDGRGRCGGGREARPRGHGPRPRGRRVTP